MKVDDTADNVDLCLCPDCPSYNNCMGMAAETLYCARGISSCEVEARRCVCPKCPVWGNYELSSTYFCMKGAAE